MTAEIAILNTSAVALAADSAVTISKSSGGPKIFNTANKLFTLSKYAPVGVMIYGAADLMGVPWETLIKMFRRDLGRRRFAQLQEYAEHFVKYVQSNASVFPASLQDEYAANTVRSALMSTRANVDRTIKSVTDSGATLTARRFKSLVALRIKEAYEAWEARPRLDELPAGFEDALRTQYSEMIRSTIDAVFGDLPLAADSKIRLGELAIARLSRRWLPANKAGVVIAGFGEDDIFPALTFYEVEAVVLHHLRRIPGGTVRVGVDCTAAVVPFAQLTEVQTFMTGVNPGYNEAIENLLRAVFMGYPEQVLQQVASIGPRTRRRLVQELREKGEGVAKDMVDRLAKMRDEQFSQPVVESVGFLPRDELAQMAESLVNLTSFRQRVTGDFETVGGPIDVSVISKGDGFVWIKRKHYFRPELNQHFFANYFGDAGATEVE